ncbi:acyl-CoA dehydrogenase [Tsukamurella ocularis]|uniref:acyl-CoA dehydrogenase n=1 Tax=Tsukamurella ocularis TaxID=1970234 RepID=UPI002168055E|nr:acyl-CoA dehydrogenase [Tsukamurella ocularis]MCS3781406.1 alkylation response protein AidB-like acyl-CoA dehydrogenase [Tsukamurella ocularis]MCS3787778.1 alkylation response protein AidB-like acyl-CoA dehydrogenase [Tsukamurella ocularis]MCS3851072.1 alkylation response protein AidB-like acyl-CoA dehydrogenase [Tsukamurella ocularis]
MGHYKSNVRDIEFNLFEDLGVGEVLASGAYGDLDEDTAKEMLREAARQAEGPIAESFAEADRNPPVFNPETHEVTINEAFKKSQAIFGDGGWAYLGLNDELGGTDVPRSLYWGIGELFLGANPPIFMFAAGPGFAQILFDEGTDEQKKWAKIAAERNWNATMVLTEPDAGSDVGAGRTKAIKQEDGSWHIEGVKRFITSAVMDGMFESTFHLVLARPEGGAPGTKGLGLYFVPKHHFDEQGNLGEENGVYVTGVEHKMGIKTSTTCEVTFGGHGKPAKGWLVGEEIKGIAQMFKVIEHARMMVGTKAIGTLSTGYLNALDYAKQRVQGADLTQMTDKTAPRVTITHHPDVRRSLLTQKAYAEGLRAVYLYTAAHQDVRTATPVSGADEEMAFKVNDLLLPIVKGVGSERAFTLLGTESLQTFGGSGFLQDYPIEQYVRDSKIDSLYEGTTAIQAQDFFFRKILRDRGAALGHIAGQITAFIEANAGGAFAAQVAQLKTAAEDVQAMAATLTGFALASQQEPKELYKVGLGSVRFLMAFGDLMVGWRLLHQAVVAQAKIDGGATGADKSFYEGKVGVATFFAANMLPLLTSVKDVVAAVDNQAMDLDEAAF